MIENSNLHYQGHEKELQKVHRGGFLSNIFFTTIIFTNEKAAFSYDNTVVYCILQKAYKNPFVYVDVRIISNIHICLLR